MSKTNIFFPHGLTPQGFINDFLTAQMYSEDFKKVREYVHHDDFLEKTNYKLFSFHPMFENLFETEYLPKTPKNPTGNPEKDATKMANYVNLLSHLKPSQQAACVPYVRLYVKFVTPKTKKVIGQKDIIFKTYTSVNDKEGAWYELGSKTEQTIGNDAGIQSVNVSRSFQFMGVDNRYNINIAYLFKNMHTFAAGSPQTNDVYYNDKLTSVPKGGDYIYLIKRMGKRQDAKRIQEHLFLEYGWKLPPDVDTDIFTQEQRTLFQEQEKKELRLYCHKHQFTFNQTGEIMLNVSYVAAPLATIRTRDENQKNDAFSVSNKTLINQMFSKKTGVSELGEQIKAAQLRLKGLLELKQKTIKCECIPKSEKEQYAIAEKSLNKEITTLREQLLAEMQQVFIRYFYVRQQLFYTHFQTSFSSMAENITHKSNPIVRMRIARYDEKKTAKPLEKEVTPTLSGLYEKLKTSFAPLRKNATNEKEVREIYGFPPTDDAGTVWLKYSLKRFMDVVTLGTIPRQYSEGEKEYGTYQNVDYGHFTFFPLRALLASIYEFAKGHTNPGDGSSEIDKFPSICLGNMVHTSHGKDYWLNMGDILIEVGVFQRWLYNEFVLSDQVSPTIDQFLSSIFNDLVPQALSMRTGHYPADSHGKIVQNQFEILPSFRKNWKRTNMAKKRKVSLYSIEDAKQFAQATALESALIGSIRTDASAKEIKESLLYYYQETYATDSVKQASSAFLKRFGEREFNAVKDFKDGIYHVYLGQDSGIVQNIRFSYLNDAYLNTLLALRNPNDLEPYLRYTYKAGVTFTGNNLYYGRSAFFAIPVNQFNIQKDRDPFGITGYYRIESTTDSITNGVYTTTVNATNVYSPPAPKSKADNPDCPECKKGSKSKKKKVEKSIPIYVEHDLAEYAGDVLTASPGMATNFSLKHLKKEKKNVNQPYLDTLGALKATGDPKAGSTSPWSAPLPPPTLKQQVKKTSSKT